MSLTIILLLTCLVNTAGQNNRYTNEPKGFELFKNGKWKLLKPFVSTKKEIEKVFGKDCVDGCDYDEDWRVHISYVSQCWSYSVEEEKTIRRVPEEMIGKYLSISFEPKNRIKRNQFRFGSQLERSDGWTADGLSPHSWYSYDDSFGLSYSFSAVDTEDGKFRKDDLVRIKYAYTVSGGEKYDGEIGC